MYIMNRFIFILLLIVAGTNVKAQDFGRREKINDDWYFNLGDIQYGGIENMDCSKWTVVDLPHDWTVEQNASPELASCTGYLPGGIAWYRKEINVPALEKGNKAVGERKPYDPETGIIAWIVNYEPGELKVIAFNNGKEAAAYKITTNTMPAKIDAEVLKPIDNETLRQIRVQILDANGNHSILADNEITCEITGGTLLGMENASTNVAENYQDNKQRCINGRLFIYIKKDAADNPISLKLSSPLLDSVELKIE